MHCWRKGCVPCSPLPYNVHSLFLKSLPCICQYQTLPQFWIMLEEMLDSGGRLAHITFLLDLHDSAPIDVVLFQQLVQFLPNARTLRELRITCKQQRRASVDSVWKGGPHHCICVAWISLANFRLCATFRRIRFSRQQPPTNC